jgi:hypothetical protein
MRPALPWE